MEIQELKTIITEIKVLLNGLQSRLEMAEKTKLNEAEEKSLTMTWSEEHRNETEKSMHIISLQGNANQNHEETPFHTP